ncbi:MAG TPA: LysM peptidoglycan-binding domain-containing protein, partial [Candidatus Ozemobacteraceae bacterium]|nr:LysM peptidoglycan-binding domain-containing protein [Candidatus Ozemobacteraceae bacterium]
MLIKDRRGIIGFMLTMALGVALGAATLVVGNEVVKGVKNKLTKDGKTVQTTPKTGGIASNPVVEKAWNEYQKARKAYDEAVFNRSADWQQKKAEMERLRETWKKAVLNRTPGVGSVTAGQNQSGTSSGSQANPFGGGNVQVEPSPLQNQTSAGQKTTSTVSAKPVAPTSGTSSDQISLEYYKVRSGDSFSDICERYYGDKGMWAHILSYQIPSIAATPNLIFPGQIIVLPRSLTAGAKPPATSSANQSASSNTQTSPSAAGNYQIAPAGDESWDDTFQKNYVVSDKTLTDTNTMTVAQIQSFLDQKGSCLAKPYNGSTPAQMIYNAAKKYGINP